MAHIVGNPVGKSGPLHRRVPDPVDEVALVKPLPGPATEDPGQTIPPLPNRFPLYPLPKMLILSLIGQMVSPVSAREG